MANPVFHCCRFLPLLLGLLFALTTPSARGQYAAVLQGRIAMENQDYPAAIVAYTRALRVAPKFPDLYFQRARAFTRTQKFTQAIADYTTYLRLLPDDPIAHGNRAMVHELQGAFAKAEADYARAIALDPQNATLPNNRGGMRLTRKRYANAQADFDRALRLNPSYSEAYVNRGRARYQLGDYTRALKDFEEALRYRLTPGGIVGNQPVSNHALQHGALAWFRATCPDPRLRDATEALRHAQQACEQTNWKNAYLLDTLAAAHAEAGEFLEAVRRQKESLAKAKYEPKERREAQARLRLYEQGKPFRDTAPNTRS